MGAVPNTEVPEAIRHMDVFVLPSTLDSESFGVSAVEAMACGVPVIASDVDGFRETVADGETGYLIPRKNSHAIAARLEELWKSEQLRTSMGQAGRERVLRLYDFHCNVMDMEKLYEETMLAEKPAR
jgi:glycosyltransferase involved in cell wall biosynthesis